MKGAKKCTSLMVISIVVICATFVFAQDWPQYLGPNRDGTSLQTGLLRTWPEDGPEVLWTVDVGIGFGGPVVQNGKVYLLDRDDEVGDNLRCFDFSNGEELWNYAYDAPGSVMFPGSRSVPAVDGDYVYSCGPYGDLYCININTHGPVWNKNVWTDFDGDPGNGPGGLGGFSGHGNFPIWAITQCPLVYGDLLIMLSQAPEAGAVAYNKLTGDIVWKTPYLGNESYASPSVVKIDGEDQIVMVISSTNPVGRRELPQTLGHVVGIGPLTGEILWDYDEWQCHISVPSAVDAGNNKVLVVGGYEFGTVMLQVEKMADGTYGVTELFKHEDFGGHTKPPVLYNGYFYGQYGTNSRRDGLVCMSMDGEVVWKTQRSPAFDKGSMILVGDLILATDGATTLYLIEPDPSGFKQIASAELLDTGQNWAPLALADGRLLIRDQSQLMCLRVAR